MKAEETKQICDRCGEERPQRKMIQHKCIRHRTQRHLEKLLWYCKDKGCAGLQQMGYEG